MNRRKIEAAIYVRCEELVKSRKMPYDQYELLLGEIQCLIDKLLLLKGDF